MAHMTDCTNVAGAGGFGAPPPDHAGARQERDLDEPRHAPPRATGGRCLVPRGPARHTALKALIRVSPPGSSRAVGRVAYSPLIHLFEGMPPKAICGAGILYARVPVAFAPDDPDACYDCSQAIGSETARPKRN